MMNFKIISLFILVLTFHAANSQNETIEHYTTLDGLPQVQVTDFVQDNDGYLWFGTKNGLSKFNGERFLNFNLPDGKYTNIRKIEYVVPDDELLLVIDNDLYQFKNPSFIKIPLENNSSELKIIPGSHFVSYKDSMGSLILYDIKKGKVLCSSKISDKIVSPVYFNFQDSTFSFIDFENRVFLVRNIGDCDQAYAPVNIPIEISGSYSIFHVNSAPYYIHHNNGSHKVFSIKDRKVILEFTDDLSIIFKDDNLNLGALVYNKVIYKVESNLLNALNSKINFFKNKILVDYDNNIWYSEEPGVHCILNTPFKYYDYSKIKDVWTINSCEGKLIAASYSNGLYYIDSIDSISNIDNKNLSKKGFYYFGSSSDGRGTLYFPTTTGVRIFNSCSSFKDLNIGTSLVSYYDVSRDLFLTGHKKYITVHKGTEYNRVPLSDYIDRHIVSITKWEDNYIFGTYSGTIELDSNFNFVRDLGALYGSDKVSQSSISLYTDTYGNLWSGKGNGLYLLLKDSLVVKQILKDNIRGIILAIIQKDEHLIIGTSNELVILNLEKYYSESDIEIKRYNYHNGLMCEEVAQQGFKIIRDKLYIPSSSYLAYVKTEELNYKDQFANLKIISINDIPIDTNSIRIKSIDALVKYEAIGFNRPSLSQYRHRLNNNKWSDWSENNFCFLKNCPEGNNTLSIQTNTAGYNKFIQSNINFKVSLPFYKSESFIYTILGFGFIFGCLLLIAFRNNYRLLKRSKVDDFELKYLKIRTLQTQMNPHFIFNVLGTLQHTIVTGNLSKANDQLIKLSNLIRRFLNSSVKDDATNITNSNHSLGEEIDLLKLYVEFEKIQYKDKFDYEFVIKDIDYNMAIPPFLVQPYIENAIKHGLLEKKIVGRLLISIYFDSSFLNFVIEDDGIGVAASKLLQSNSKKKFKSLGTKLTYERIKLLNQMGQGIFVDTYDRPNGGTIVTIKIRRKNE